MKCTLSLVGPGYLIAAFKKQLKNVLLGIVLTFPGLLCVHVCSCIYFHKHDQLSMGYDLVSSSIEQQISDV